MNEGELDFFSSLKQEIMKLYLNQAICLMSSVRQLSGRLGFHPRTSHTKDSKNVTWFRHV